jgi:hypothetical protein
VVSSNLTRAAVFDRFLCTLCTLCTLASLCTLPLCFAPHCVRTTLRLLRTTNARSGHAVGSGVETAPRVHYARSGTTNVRQRWGKRGSPPAARHCVPPPTTSVRSVFGSKMSTFYLRSIGARSIERLAFFDRYSCGLLTSVRSAPFNLRSFGPKRSKNCFATRAAGTQWGRRGRTHEVVRKLNGARRCAAKAAN